MTQYRVSPYTKHHMMSLMDPHQRREAEAGRIKLFEGTKYRVTSDIGQRGVFNTKEEAVAHAHKLAATETARQEKTERHGAAHGTPTEGNPHPGTIGHWVTANGHHILIED